MKLQVHETVFRVKTIFLTAFFEYIPVMDVKFVQQSEPQIVDEIIMMGLAVDDPVLKICTVGTDGNRNIFQIADTSRF